MAWPDYLNLSNELGISIWLLIIILIWSLAWKLGAMWKAARKKSLIWFVVLGVVNTIGILEILYIFVFSKLDFTEKKTKRKKSKKK